MNKFTIWGIIVVVIVLIAGAYLWIQHRPETTLPATEQSSQYLESTSQVTNTKTGTKSNTSAALQPPPLPE